ncbi:ATP synthase subunit I, partial [Candidatus Poribacteria bacterium]|nr:ATP synthase subunit I [Candidatus Poribacteria bacterium]
SSIPSYVRSRLIVGVYRASIVLALLMALGTLPWGVEHSASALIGSAVAIVFFWSLERTLGWLYQRQSKRNRLRTVGWFVGKYAVVGSGIYVLYRRGWLRLESFALGLCVVYFGAVLSLIWSQVGRKLQTSRPPSDRND